MTDEAVRPKPLRIAYLAHGIGGRQDGVRSKILAQAAAWTRLDPTVAVGVFVRCEAGTERDWRDEPGVVSVRSSRAGIAGRYVARERLTIDVLRWKPDVVYLRFGTVSPSLVVLSVLRPTVVELNTLDLAELRVRSKARFLYARATRNLLLGRASGLVAVAAEIASHPSVLRLDRPTAVVPNGIELDAVPALPAPHNAAPRLVFIGAPRLPWHGLDQIDELARQLPAWRFDIIGPDASELAGHAPNVYFHGRLERPTYLSLVASADLAIGPLALHRKGMSEASPLKVAEYLAYGLPVVIGYADTRFAGDPPFLLRIPNADGAAAAAASRIDEFARTWMGRRVDRAAVGAIDVGAIERGRLELLRAAAEGT